MKPAPPVTSAMAPPNRMSDDLIRTAEMPWQRTEPGGRANRQVPRRHVACNHRPGGNQRTLTNDYAGKDRRVGADRRAAADCWRRERRLDANRELVVGEHDVRADEHPILDDRAGRDVDHRLDADTTADDRVVVHD